MIASPSPINRTIERHSDGGSVPPARRTRMSITRIAGVWPVRLQKNTK